MRSRVARLRADPTVLGIAQIIDSAGTDYSVALGSRLVLRTWSPVARGVAQASGAATILIVPRQVGTSHVEVATGCSTPGCLAVP